MNYKSTASFPFLGISLCFLASLASAGGAKTVTSVPAGFKECAKDFGKCNLSGKWTGYYGANSVFVEISGSGPFECLGSKLNVGDPVPNVQKTCFVKESVLTKVPAGFKECAKDFGKCNAVGEWTGYYGANSVFVEISGSGPFECLGSKLNVGDPVPNVQKTCFVKDSVLAAVPAGFTECAKDFGKCEVTGAWTGYYGANSVFVPISGSGPFECLGSKLNVGDPVPNVQKACFFKVSDAPKTAEKPPESAPPSTPAKPLKTYPNLAFAAVDGDYESVKAMIAKMPHDLERTSSRGETALTVAVDYQNLDAVRAFIEAGANVNVTTKGNDHLFHILAKSKNEYGNVDITENSTKIARLIWEKCPYRRPRDAYGKTPLEWVQKIAGSVRGTRYQTPVMSLGMEFERIQNNAAPGCP